MISLPPTTSPTTDPLPGRRIHPTFQVVASAHALAAVELMMRLAAQVARDRSWVVEP